VVRHFVDNRPDILQTMAMQAKKFDEVFVELHHSVAAGFLDNLGIPSTYQTICYVSALFKVLPAVAAGIRSIMATMGIRNVDEERTEENACSKKPKLSDERTSATSHLSETASQSAMHHTKGKHTAAAIDMGALMADELASMKCVTEKHLLANGVTQAEVDMLKSYNPKKNGLEVILLFIDYMAGRVEQVIKEDNAKKVDQDKGELDWWLNQQLLSTISGICIRLREKQCDAKKHLVTCKACGTTIDVMRPCIVAFLRAPGLAHFDDTPVANSAAVVWLKQLCDELRKTTRGYEAGSEFSLPYTICDYKESVATQMDRLSMYNRFLAQARQSFEKQYNNKFKNLSHCETLF
jgi:hypothetical protein